MRATPTYTAKSWTKEQYERLLEEHKKGLRPRQIASVLGKTITAVRSKLTYLGLYGCPLTHAQEKEVVKRLKAGQSVARIHYEVGVAKGKIRTTKAKHLIDLFVVGILSDTEAAYLAGIIDGEGTIMLSMRGDRKSIPRIIMSVANTNFAMIRWIKDRVKCGAINDHIRSRHKDAQNRRDQMRWTADGKCAVSILAQIEPYMVCKGRQSQIVRRLYDVFLSNHPYAHSEEELREIASMVKEIRKLNKRGRL